MGRECFCFALQRATDPEGQVNLSVDGITYLPLVLMKLPIVQLRPLSYRIPDGSMPPSIVYQLIKDMRQLDCNPR